MRTALKTLSLFTFGLITLPRLFATTFVVPTDRDMVRRADAIVVAEAVTSYPQANDAGGIETVTVLSVEEVVKGMYRISSDTVEVHEPGGELDGSATIIAGVPRFTAGERVIAFLSRTPQHTWAVTELVLGNFHLVSDRAGRHVAVREESDVVGWEANGQPHREQRRSEELFLQFLRTEAKGGMGAENYFVPTEPVVMPHHVSAAAVSAFATGRTYTTDLSSGLGARWSAFPNGVNFFAGSPGEPGAPGNGTTAVQVAINSWDGDAGSNINYVYAGTDSTHTAGISAPDGVNTVLF